MRPSSNQGAQQRDHSGWTRWAAHVDMQATKQQGGVADFRKAGRAQQEAIRRLPVKGKEDAEGSQHSCSWNLTSMQTPQLGH